MARSFAVDWQNKTPAFFIEITDPNARNPRTALKDETRKVAWIESLQADDEIYTELGASADILTLLAIKRGAKVFRVQTRLLKEWREQQNLDASATLLSIVHFAKEKREAFYATTPATNDILALKCLVAHYEITQEMRKSANLRLRQVATREYYLLKGTPETADEPIVAGTGEATTSKITDILEAARKQAMSIVEQTPGLKALKRRISAQLNPRRLIKEVLEKLQGRAPKAQDVDLETYLDRRFAESHIFWGVAEEEAYYAAEVELKLKGMALWTDVYDQIPGMGPKISARIAAAIGDIRRFPTYDALNCYFGYHVREDGSCPRRTRGVGHPEVRGHMAETKKRLVDYGGWNKLGRQGLYLWCEQVNKASLERAPELFPFKLKLIERKAFVARKSWLKAAKAAQAEGETSAALNDLIAAIELGGEDWLRKGIGLMEDGSNPYLICANNAFVKSQPWLFRDALTELLRKAGEDVPQDTLDDDAEDDESEATEDEEATKPKAKAKAVAGALGIPKLALDKTTVREVRTLMRDPNLSKKRIHLGSYRWLINAILVRKHLWPLYQAFVAKTSGQTATEPAVLPVKARTPKVSEQEATV